MPPGNYGKLTTSTQELAAGNLTMPLLLLICFLLGAVLGQRYKFLALIPAMALAIPVIIILQHASVSWQMLGAAFLAITTLQVGYVVGLGIQYWMSNNRTSSAFAPQSSISKLQRRPTDGLTHVS